MANGQLLVFAISAFWHGLYAGYYLSFFYWYIFNAISYAVFKIMQAR